MQILLFCATFENIFHFPVRINLHRIDNKQHHMKVEIAWIWMVTHQGFIHILLGVFLYSPIWVACPSQVTLNSLPSCPNNSPVPIYTCGLREALSEPNKTTQGPWPGLENRSFDLDSSSLIHVARALYLLYDSTPLGIYKQVSQPRG